MLRRISVLRAPLDRRTAGPSSDATSKPHPLVLHPLLVAAYPVAFLFAQNLDERLTLEMMVGPLLVALGGSAAMLLIIGGVIRDYVRAGLLTSLLLALFFSYGYVWSALEGYLGSHRFLLIAWGLCAYFGAVIIWRARWDVSRITTGLNVVSGVLLAMNVIPIAADQARAAGQSARLEEADPLVAPGSPTGLSRPDIYYLIFDRYGSERTLERQYDFDNSEFLDGLEARGFYVASESNANYPITNHSLASSLSMGFLDAEALKAAGRNAADMTPLYDIVGGPHRVGTYLKSQGYEYYQVATWWGLGAENSEADLTFRYSRTSEFASALYETTALIGVAPFVLPEDADPRQIYRQHTLYQFDVLNRIRDAPGPQFVYAHFALPHDPYVFDRDGNYVSDYVASSRSVEESYLEQVRYANKRILELVDHLLAVELDERPVIVLQADEGPRPARFQADILAFNWLTATREELRGKLGILNAFYLPGDDHSELYPRITPVNNFRVIFNRYFDTDLPLLPDRSFVFRNLHHPYDFTDVTDELNE